MPTQPPPVPSVVSIDHIAQVRAIDEEFKGLDARYGGGLMREAVTAQLRYRAELLKAHCPESLHDDLFTAVGSFAETAKLIMVTGDPREAAAVGTQALDWAGPLRSGRVIISLRDLDRLAEPHTNLPEVADLRARLRTTLAA